MTTTARRYSTPEEQIAAPVPPCVTPESPITPRQAEILGFICDHVSIHGSWPSLRQVMDRLDFASTNSVVAHLHPLERKGYLGRRGDRVSSGYDILRMPPGRCPFSVTADGAKIRVAVITATLTVDEAGDLATRIMTVAREQAARRQTA